MVNPEFAGRHYPAGPVYVVGREKIREFAEAVGATHPSHARVTAARELGYSDVVAPATFAVVLAQRAEAQFIEDPDAGIDFSRVVHADERFSHERPIVAGDELVTDVTVESIVQRSSLTMVTTRAQIFTADATGQPADLVSTVYSTLAVRGADA